MRLVIVSDTHCQLDKIDIPDGDVLVHCGDALSYGRVGEFTEFATQLAKLAPKFDLILYTPGNHDTCVQFGLGPAMARETLAAASPKIEMLLHESFRFEWMGEAITFFGSPWVPQFGNWSFMYPRSEGRGLWEDIPEKVDVVFTHGMPYGIMDRVWRIFEDEDDDHVGCKALRDRLDAVKPKVFAGGHLHMEGGNYLINNDTLYVNAAICDDSYQPTRKPIVIDTDTWSVIS
jgi:Icc-related predicted phosphoesterase